MKSRIISLFLALMLICCAAFPGVAEESVDPDALLDALTGTYDELFTVICAPEYDDIWMERCTEYVGEAYAAATADMLKSACVGEIYGQEAMDAYADNLEGVQFDCFFINGVHQIAFDGHEVSGLDAEGNEVFRHTYSYVETADTLACYIYKTDDADAGEFTYLCLAPDTPDTTYHIEFRYGSDLDALKQLYEGPYAYWLAAGILADADGAMIYNCIDLFCAENTAEEAA